MSHFAGVHSCFALYAAAVHINVLAGVDSRLHIEQLLFFAEP